MMSAHKTYRRHCTNCNEETVHESVHPRPLQVAIRTWRIIVFCVSFAMLYPHTFSPDDELMVKCTKCGASGPTSYE
jgi:ribosomal protein L44E